MASVTSTLLARTRARLCLTKRLVSSPQILRTSTACLGKRCASSEASERVVNDAPVEVQSPHRILDIPDNVGLAEHMMKHFPKYGERVAIVDGITGEETTYNQLTTKITRVASAFVKAGLKKGDVVTIFSPNCPEFAITYLAAAAMGAVVSALNPVYTAGELRHAVSHAGTKFLITSPALVSLSREAVRDCLEIKGIIVYGEADGCRPFKTMLEDNGSAFPENLDFNPKEDLVALPYSSGTTGLPKGVMLTHHNIVSNVEQISTSDVLPYGVDDSLVGVLPFFHIYGQVVVFLSGLFQGAKITTMPRFEPEVFLQILNKQRATFLHVVPPIVLFMAQHPMVPKYDLSSLSGLMCAAAPISPHVFQLLLDRIASPRPFSIRQVLAPTVMLLFSNNLSLNALNAFTVGYGLTECSPVSHCNPPVGFKYSSIGQPVHNTESKVVDVTTGKTLGHGHEGEVCVRGPQVMKGYHMNPKATAETVDSEGWLHTGDIGYCQPDGHFYITDRLKELIKVKGLQVAPAELEALLLQHPSVQDTAVIGVADEKAGELPRAYIVLKPSSPPDEDDIHSFVKERAAPFKQLAGGIEFVNEIPKSASGKILRRYLRDDYKEKYGKN